MFDLFVEELKESGYNVYWEGLNAKRFPESLKTVKDCIW